MASATDFMATWQGRAADLVAMSGATVTAVEHPVTTNGMSTTRKRFSITAETVLSCANCKLQVDKVVCPAVVFRHADGQRQKLDAAEENFKNSDTLKMLLERSEANRAKNKKAIQNKYCYRQAELGIGDCGGLRYIPGMTKSGKQKTPKWLSDALGVEQPPATEGQGKTLADLLGNDASE
eukprot:jgi/Chrzof1/11613/Cz06g02090.t1